MHMRVRLLKKFQAVFSMHNVHEDFNFPISYLQVSHNTCEARSIWSRTHSDSEQKRNALDTSGQIQMLNLAIHNNSEGLTSI